jgi:hypothetical protein
MFFQSIFPFLGLVLICRPYRYQAHLNNYIFFTSFLCSLPVRCYFTRLIEYSELLDDYRTSSEGMHRLSGRIPDIENGRISGQLVRYL